MEIHLGGLALVLAGGSKAFPVIERFEIAAFPPESIRFSLKEQNLLDAETLKNIISASYLKLCTTNRRVSLSIPDTVGRTLLLEMETPFKNKAEGVDQVRWKLKKNFPLDLNDVQLDFQILQKREGGESLLLVSLVSKSVIQEYEDLIVDAGLEPYQIDFTSFNIYQLFSHHLDIQNSVSFIMLYRGIITVLIFKEGLLDFCRNKYLGSSGFDPTRLYREINSSLLVYYDTKGGAKPETLFYYAADDERSIMRNVIIEATGIVPFLLETEAIQGRSRQHLDRAEIPNLLSGLGAAARGLK
jgi:type IV pilus assembly protein PilM